MKTFDEQLADLRAVKFDANKEFEAAKALIQEAISKGCRSIDDKFETRAGRFTFSTNVGFAFNKDVYCDGKNKSVAMLKVLFQNLYFVKAIENALVESIGHRNRMLRENRIADRNANRKNKKQ
jgi:hypothetical protein